jgi:hypothetical protein
MSESNPYEPIPYVKIKHPEWTKNAVIYQINTRQFTEEGTLAAAEAHLSRLKDLGADILWMMPIHEIGQKHRKGSLGSPYAVKDYYSVNRHLGTLADLKHFVTAAHELGMYVILDWVANHTAWDNNLVSEHPEWYVRDWKGEFCPTPWWDWPDIIDLDYQHSALREYMTKAMKYWVSEVDIDGYRCDVAGFVPTDFWNNVRRELDAIKPVFMLAEWESRDLHAEAFDMTYAWSWNEAVHRIAMHQANLNGLFVFYSWNQKAFPEDSMRMTFVSNHDKNAWEGTEFEQFGDGLKTAWSSPCLAKGCPSFTMAKKQPTSSDSNSSSEIPSSGDPTPTGNSTRVSSPLKKLIPHSGTLDGEREWSMFPIALRSRCSVLSAKMNATRSLQCSISPRNDRGSLFRSASIAENISTFLANDPWSWANPSE